MIEFNHNANTIYEALGFTKEEFIKVVKEMKNNFTDRLKEKDDKALVLLASKLVLAVISFEKTTPVIGLFFSVLMDKVKVSQVIELIYKKLKQMEPDDILKIAEELIDAEKISFEMLRLMRKGAIVSVISKLLKELTDDNDEKE